MLVKDSTVHLDQLDPQQLLEIEAQLDQQYQDIVASNLALDLTRGKPGREQLALSDALDGILEGNYTDSNGTDLRNYGGLDGLPEAKELFSEILGVSPEQTLVAGNSSLTLMYYSVMQALLVGVDGEQSAWKNEGEISFLCPSPGYDRHFTVCERLGIRMIPVAMTDTGPDMDEVEQLVEADPRIKGIWCVPRFSNPTGIVYSDETVERIAKLGQISGPNFRVMWDNTYAVHSLDDDAPELAPIMAFCEQHGTKDNVLQFGSTSKITFAGAGVGFMGASAKNLQALIQFMSTLSIGPDKINQMRHVAFLKDSDTLAAHMRKHAALIAPRFDAVFDALRSELADTGMGDWTEPAGGYFISFNTRPGLAREVVRLAGEAGVKLTPAGATYPYGDDPGDRNIRIAPTVPSLEEVKKAMAVFVLCVKLASVRQKLAG
jgi:aspartate/methionine/tyrosine aminotransferase